MKKYLLTFFLPAAALVLLATGAMAKERAGAFVPVPGAECRDLKTIADKALGADFAISYDAPFTYFKEDGSGKEKDQTWRGCTLTVKGTGREFPDGPAGEDLKLRGAFKGWTNQTDNSFYGNYETSGGRSALRRGDRLLVIEAG